MSFSPESNSKETESGKEKEPKVILHICLRSEWEKALPTGEYLGEDFTKDGFIHCSAKEQIGGVSQRVPEGDFVVLEIDANKVVPEIKYEPSSSGELYPHIYGPLNIDAVIKIDDFQREDK